MNFEFVTSQLSMNTVARSGSVDSSSQSGSGSDTVSNLFVNKLHQLLAKNGIKQNGVLSVESTKELSSIDSTQLLKDLESATGVEFLTKLKQYLMASGYNELKDVSLGDDGLDAIKAMVVKAGFSQSQVESLIKMVKSESDNGNVLVSDIMDGLLSLDSEDISLTDKELFSVKESTDKEESGSELDDKEGSTLLDISATPFITSILQSLGVPDDIINSIIEDSEVKGEGIRLNRLITDLQELQKNSFFTGKNFQNSSDVDSIKGMFKQLDLSSEAATGDKKVDLGDFASALEGLRRDNTSTEDENQTAAESSINGLNQSRKNPLSLIASLENNQVAGKSKLNSDVVESDTLIKKFMGDIHPNNTLAVKSTEESNPTDSEMNFRTLKNVNHQLLMTLSATQKNSANLDDALLKTDSSRMMEKFKLLSGQDGEKSNASSNEILKNILSSQENVDETQSKNSSGLLDQMVQKKMINLSMVQDEQSAKSASDTLVGKLAGTAAKDGDVLSGLINLINNSETLTSTKKNGQQSRSENSENGLESILSRVDKKQSLNTLAVKSTEESTPTESEMNFRTLKNVNHQLLMTLSATQKNSANLDDALLKTDSSRMMEKFKLLSGQDGEKSNTSSNEILKNILSSQENVDETQSKNSSGLLDQMVQKKMINLSMVQDEQIAKSASDTLVGKLAGTAAKDGDVLSGLINLINNSETLTSTKKNGQQSRSDNSENGLESILSRVDKKQSLNTLASNQSGSSFSGGSDGKNSASGLTQERSTSSLLPSYVTNQVGKSISRAFSRGESEIKLQLRPAELGRIFMTIESAGDTLKVSVVTENRAAKDILAGHINDIKSSLANSGINLESFDVEMGSDFKQSLADSGQQPNGSSDSGKKRGSGQNSSISAGEVDSSVSPNFLSNEDGMLHFVA